jgi:hypothetical protein
MWQGGEAGTWWTGHTDLLNDRGNVRAFISAPIDLGISDADKTGKSRIEGLRELLRPTGWLIDTTGDSALNETLTSSLLSRFPDDVGMRVKASPRVLVDVGNNELGIASLENENALHLRVVKDDARHEDMQHLIEEVCSTLTPLLAPLTPPTQSVFSRIEILESGSKHPAATGEMADIHALSFRRFVRKERSTEFRLLAMLTIAFVVTFTASLALAVFAGTDPVLQEAKGWVERIASAFLVSALTSVITLSIQYRRWKNEKIVINWR